MLTYLETKDERKCCGCRACEQVCPVGALTMEKNSEGFYYPKLYEDKCIHCSLCEKVCPEMSRPEGQVPLAVYALQHKNEEILKKSSSGGAFRLLADEMIRQGGCVVGCVWNEEFHPVLKIAETMEELVPMQGSKYISSDTGDVFKQVEKRLKAGQKVLFTGSSCQCAGMLKYLRKPYENLLTADFLCHGMPSQQTFDAYFAELNRKHKITSYQFRDKGKQGWGVVSSYTWDKNGTEKKKYRVGKTDAYNFGFLNGCFNRYSCYSCPFRGEDRLTDFTFCDYWDVEKYHPQIESEKGVSAISVNTTKAEKLLKTVKTEAVCIKTDVQQVANANPYLTEKLEDQVPLSRAAIITQIEKDGWNSVQKQLREKDYWAKRAWYALPMGLKKKLKSLIH